jgi:hypothetical protein
MPQKPSKCFACPQEPGDDQNPVLLRDMQGMLSGPLSLCRYCFDNNREVGDGKPRYQDVARQ